MSEKRIGTLIYDPSMGGTFEDTPRRADCSDVEEIDDGSQKEICKARLPICDRSGEYSGMSV